MFLFSEAARERFERNRRKANGIVSTHGPEALTYVSQQIEERSLSRRNRAHWQRVKRHVVVLLQQYA